MCGGDTICTVVVFQQLLCSPGLVGWVCCQGDGWHVGDTRRDGDSVVDTHFLLHSLTHS